MAFQSLKQLPMILMIAAAAGIFAIQNCEAQQACGSDVVNLQVCAPYLLPSGAAANTTPSAECCGALHSVNRDCICSALRVAATLPSQCSVPPLNCDVSA